MQSSFPQPDRPNVPVAVGSVGLGTMPPRRPGKGYDEADKWVTVGFQSADPGGRRPVVAKPWKMRHYEEKSPYETIDSFQEAGPECTTRIPLLRYHPK